jgi:hypothetical protein
MPKSRRQYGGVKHTSSTQEDKDFLPKRPSAQQEEDESIAVHKANIACKNLSNGKCPKGPACEISGIKIHSPNIRSNFGTLLHSTFTMVDSATWTMHSLR